MLIEFSISNYKSIRDEARLSLVADQGREHRDTNVIEPSLMAESRPRHLVRSAAIYGANAAGKTNLLEALGAMKTMVRESGRGLDSLPMVPFRFEPAHAAMPTTMDVMIVVDGVRYQYGFAATATSVEKEWLHAWPRGRVQTWYEREADQYMFRDGLKGDKEVWGRTTRSDALFLSTAVGLNSEQLRPIHEWFVRRLRIAGIQGWSPVFSLECCEDDERRTEIVDFLRSADFAISDLTLKKEEFDPGMLPKEMSSALRHQLRDDLKGAEIASLTLTHETPEGVSGNLDIEDESDGTQKMFALAGPWLDALEHGYVVVLDELHDNLHPNLVRFLIDCFHDPLRNVNGAQLLFTTHETAILNQNVFRRDQVWFCERDQMLATKLFALNEFRLRKGVVNLERAYLTGRFGALPFISPLHQASGQERE